jgi:YfiH family protein
MYMNIHINAGHTGLTCLRFQGLEDFKTVSHAVFTRKGGLSSGAYGSLNSSFGVGDDPERVKDNRRLIQKSLRAGQLVFCRQVHGTDVRIVSASPVDRAPKGWGTRPVADALVTNEPGQFLVIQVADCQPVMVYDPVRKVVANIHSGWRGSIRNVIGRTVQIMTQTFGSEEKDLLAGIGPSLGPCCSEFVNYRSEIPRPFWVYKTKNKHFDFWALSRDQLLTAGLVREHIYSSNLCTRCRTDLFYSYRGEGTTGRFAAVIGLRSEEP